jgi:hypothetical protein
MFSSDIDDNSDGEADDSFLIPTENKHVQISREAFVNNPHIALKAYFVCLAKKSLYK